MSEVSSVKRSQERDIVDWLVTNSQEIPITKVCASIARGAA